MAKKYYVDKNYVLGVIAAKGKTVKSVAEEMQISRPRLYMALNNAYVRKSSDFIDKLIKHLQLNSSLVWRDE